MTDCIVLVTGGAGFLGQHVVGLLQSRALHVSEIRVIDVMPYENKLGNMTFNLLYQTHAPFDNL